MAMYIMTFNTDYKGIIFTNASKPMESRWFQPAIGAIGFTVHHSKKMILSATKSNAINDNPASAKACKYCLQHKVSCIKPGTLIQTLVPASSTDGCIRKQIMFIQLFAYFPLFGIVIPNAFLLLADAHYTVPLLHWVLCIFLIIVIGGLFALKIRYTAGELYQRYKHTIEANDFTERT